jgi:hypothetical protein
MMGCILGLLLSVTPVENFSKSAVGQFPSGFKTYPLQRSKAVKVYTVQSEGGQKFLHADASGEAQDIGVQIFRKLDWDIQTQPRLSWRWRAKSLPVMPAGAHRDDNACGVYVVFGGWSGQSIKYVWSSDLPVGRVMEKTPGRFVVVVARSGPVGLNTWQSMTVDVAEDYRKFFKKVSGNPDGFGILTDGDQTLSPAVCDYAEFEILSQENSAPLGSVLF